MPTSQQDKALRFRALHEAPGSFVIPNPWDGASARILAGLGFQALATSSGASLIRCPAALLKRNVVKPIPPSRYGRQRASPSG